MQSGTDICVHDFNLLARCSCTGGFIMPSSIHRIQVLFHRFCLFLSHFLDIIRWLCLLFGKTSIAADTQETEKPTIMKHNNAKVFSCTVISQVLKVIRSVNEGCFRWKLRSYWNGTFSLMILLFVYRRSVLSTKHTDICESVVGFITLASIYCRRFESHRMLDFQ